jgi:serine/threonine protein kinase
MIGAGAYGVVCAAQDTTESCVVAIKKCKKIFQSRTLAKRTLRELRLLRLLDHENIVKIRSVLKPLDCDMFTEIYIVFEIMETDLAQIIRSPQTLKDQHVQYFTYQLLLSLRYLHAAKIVHRDLK